MSSPSLALGVHEASNHDEFFMKQSLRFCETLRDLKNLRKQLYSAADYFEASYGKEDEKQMVIETLKDYTIKALVNTVDHLGSVADKFNGFLEEKAGGMSGTELRLSCLEQRLRTCREYVDQGGFYQQVLLIEIPRHHKRYIFPDEDTCQSRLEYKCRSFNAGEDSRRFRSAIRATIREAPIRQGYSEKQHQRFSSRTDAFSFSRISHNKTSDKRSISPLRFPLMRSGSLLKRPSISPGLSCNQQQAREPRRSMSVSVNAERDRRITGMMQHSGKSKGMFKALLSLGRSRKDSVWFRFPGEN